MGLKAWAGILLDMYLCEGVGIKKAVLEKGGIRGIINEGCSVLQNGQ